MDLWELIAREQIRDTIARYNHAGDSGRFDAMVECFTADGVLRVVGGDDHHGREALRAFFAGVQSGTSAPNGLTSLRHCVTNTLIHEVTPEGARADSYFQVITDIGDRKSTRLNSSH